MVPLERLPSKRQGVPLDNPLEFFPLTRDNMHQNLPRILRQFFSYSVQDLQQYETLLGCLYAPHAEFQYPLAAMHGRDAIIHFWDSFLLGRALQLLDVHSLHVDMAWDPVRLQAFVQIEAWQHLKPLAWLDWLLRVPGWKVWTSQVIQFEDSPSDGPGALRVVFQEELMDQFVFLGGICFGLYCVRTDPGTPLHDLRNLVRRAAGQMIAVGTPVAVWLLRAVGVIKAPPRVEFHTVWSSDSLRD